MSLISDTEDLASGKITPATYAEKAAKDLSAFKALGQEVIAWGEAALEAFLTAKLNSTWAGLIISAVQQEVSAAEASLK